MAELDELMQRAYDLIRAQARAQAGVLAALIVQGTAARHARGATPRQIADACGLPLEDVALALAVLEQLQYVEGSPVYWRITPAGLAAYPNFLKE
ncbi:MAG: hypothetical protein N2690_10665 [Rhodocyclaceae bacterium]|nr:hypothetical protein [Rhodocyclaceae bacterium]